MTKTIDELIELADTIADIINDDGDEYASSSTDGVNTRVYVGRTLARGRKQAMGYIEIKDDGSLAFCLERRRAGVQHIVETGLANR